MARFAITLFPSWGASPWGDFERLQIQQWASGLSVKQGPASVRKIVNVLSGALQLAVDDGRLAANPAQRLKLPKISKSQKRFLSHTQVAALAKSVEAHSAGNGYGLLVLVLAYGGFGGAS